MKKTNLEKIIKEVLANQLGADPEDIEMDQLLTDELMMSPSDLSDFVVHLGSRGIDTDNVEIAEIQTLNDLVEQLSSLNIVN